MTGGEFIVLASPNVEQLAGTADRLLASGRWRKEPFRGPALVFVQAKCGIAKCSNRSDTMLLGTVFARRGSTDVLPELATTCAKDLRRGRIATLFESYWGAYVALWAAAGTLRILRDPSAAMPCYYAEIPGGVAIASSISGLIEAGLPRPSVAMDRIAECLYRDDLPSPHTGLAGVKELLPGDTMTVRAQLSLDHCWSPWDYVAIDEALTFAQRADRLREVVEDSITAWARMFGHILIGISGGLDSSIIAACTQDRSSKPGCLTLTTKDAAGDERAYAALLCCHLDLPLSEAAYDLADVNILQAANARLPRPTGRMIAQGYNAAVTRAVWQTGAEAFFTGNGGDNVFGFSQSAVSIADRFLHEGLSRGVLSTLSDVTRMTGCSLLQATRSAMRILRRPCLYSWRPEERFLAVEVLQQLKSEDMSHPWLDAPPGALPGKAAHIAALLRIQRHLDGTGQMGPAALINPLMSQPIIEACLAIPSWDWCRDGMNRSLARRAFRDILPSKIIGRTSKGSPNGFGSEIVTTFKDRITQRLLDGNLARHGLIDRQALEQRLMDDRPNWGTDQVRLLELLEAEAWMDHWCAC